MWHKKDRERNVVPEGLHGLDKQATWSFSKADRWVYGHGTFCVVSHKTPVVCLFQWMRNSDNEAKRFKQQIWRHGKSIKYACMDSKADDERLYTVLKKRLGVQLLTSPRKNMNKSPRRKKMIKELKAKRFRKIFKRRSTTVEPMQGLIADIFSLERAWMRGNKNNRWLFAAMGVAVQMAQLNALKSDRSTWDIKNDVLGY